MALLNLPVNCCSEEVNVKLFVLALPLPFEPRAADPATPLKLFLVMRGNLPIRTLLFYVLKYEPGSKSQALGWPAGWLLVSEFTALSSEVLSK